MNKVASTAYEWLWEDYPRDECISQLPRITAVEGVVRHGAPMIFGDSQLRKIQVPVLLLIGGHEMICKPEVVFRRATRLVPGLRAEIVPDANHNAEYTAPDFVNTAILEFFAQPKD